MTTNPAPSIYDDLLAAGETIANHESDLYVRVSDVSTSIIKRGLGDGRLNRAVVSTFRSAIDGTLNYEVTFGYSPYWRKRAPGAA